MAYLSTEDRQRIWRGLMRWLSNQYHDEPPSYLQPSKTEWYQAVVAADNWAEAASASYVNALPEPVRTQAPANIKALLLICVLVMRYAPGLKALLVRVLGQEVD
jgi:hypothetical protein